MAHPFMRYSSAQGTSWPRGTPVVVACRIIAKKRRQLSCSSYSRPVSEASWANKRSPLPLEANRRTLLLREALEERYLAVRAVHHHEPGAAGCARRAEARASPHPLWQRLLRLDPGSAFKKSAKIVGDVMGNFHPHGDQAIYDALVRLAQDFSSRYPLVDGQGNFGNIDGDNAAAYRYTEARLTEVARLLLDGLDEEIGRFPSELRRAFAGAGCVAGGVSQPAGKWRTWA